MTQTIYKSRPKSGKENNKTSPGERDVKNYDYETTEDVELSSNDGYTPTGVILEVMEKGDLKGVQEAKPKAAPTHKTSPIEIILAAIRKPESLAVQAYLNGRARRFLIEKYEWYKDFEDNRIMGRTLEEAYGGSFKLRLQMQKFVRNNLLISLLLCVAIFYLGRVGVDKVMGFESSPISVNVAIVNPEVKRKINTRATQTDTLKTKSRLDIQSTLKHCSVPPKVRNELLAALGNKPDYADPELSQVMRELRRFQQRFRDLGAINWYQDAKVKRAVTSNALSVVLPRVHDFLASEKSERRDIQFRLEKLQQHLGRFEAEGTLSAVDHINERIKIRNEMNMLQERWSQGPTASDLLALEDQLVTAKHVLTAIDTSDNLNWNPEAPWVIEAQTMNIHAIKKFNAEGIQDIDALMSNQTQITPRLKTYRVLNIRDHIRRLTDVLAVHKSTPKALIRKIDQSQQIANKRVNQLLPKKLDIPSGPINYRGCIPPTT